MSISALFVIENLVALELYTIYLWAEYASDVEK